MPFDGVEVSEVTERLVIGRARIEAGWCQGQMERHGWTLRGRSHEYCLVGAVRGDTPSVFARDMAMDLIVRAIFDLGYGWMCPSVFNDTHTKRQVLEVVDLAIATSRGRLARPDFQRRNP